MLRFPKYYPLATNAECLGRTVVLYFNPMCYFNGIGTTVNAFMRILNVVVLCGSFSHHVLPCDILGYCRIARNARFEGKSWPTGKSLENYSQSN